MKRLVLPNMITGGRRFNIYLTAALLVLLCSCQSPERKGRKQLSTLRLHEEVNPDPMGGSQPISVYRAHPVRFTVTRNAFLTDADVKSAKVVDQVGGFSLRIEFNRQGSWLLEQYTAANRGKHIAIFSQFANPGEDKLNEGRWLAAPQIANRLTDGVLVFTPDATRPEAEQIALGLNNVARRMQQGEK